MRYTKFLLIVLLAPLASTVLCGQTGPLNHAKYWQGLSTTARQSYAEGIVDGVNRVWDALLQQNWEFVSGEKGEALRKKVFPMLAPEPITEVMTDLYKDPANQFVQPAAMFYAARDKLLGIDITVALREARAAAIRSHELNQQIRK